MRTWQPAAVLYPDAEQVLCDATRTLGLDVDHIGRTIPKRVTTAIVWNRVGGRDEDALMQVRCFAPTDKQATDLARHLAARLPLTVTGNPIRGLTQNTGLTDLGPDEQGAMRQMLYALSLRPTQIERPVP